MSGGGRGLPLRFGRPGGNRGSMPIPVNMLPSDIRGEIEELRRDLDRTPPALRKIMLERILDDLPPDDEFPPEVQRALMRMLLLGGSGSDDSDDPDFPFPRPRGRGGRRRS